MLESGRGVPGAGPHIFGSCRQKGHWFAFRAGDRLVWFLWVDEIPPEKASSSMDGEGAVTAPLIVKGAMIGMRDVMVYIARTYVDRRGITID